MPNTVADSQQVYLDLSVDGEPRGRLVIKLAGDAPVGTRRFAQLSQGLNGVGYRLSKFDGIAQVTISGSNTCLLLFPSSRIPAYCHFCMLLFLHNVLLSMTSVASEAQGHHPNSQVPGKRHRHYNFEIVMLIALNC